MKCPKCNADTKYVVDDAHLVNIDRCLNCKGVWLDKGELGQYIGSETDIPDIAASLKAPKPTIFKCPKCVGNNLVLIPYIAKNSTTENEFIIDFCNKCEGIWLDATELSLAGKYAKQFRINLKKGS